MNTTMNDKLRETINRLRLSLEAINDGPRIGEIRLGNQDAHCEVRSWRDVLTKFDGGRFGAIDLWSADELPSYQQIILPVENPPDYLVVGQILYEPLAIERQTELIQWLPINVEPMVLETAEQFLNHYVFGTGYRELIPDLDRDPWWQFLLTQRVV